MSRINTAEFARRAREVHGDKYDYSSTVYVASGKKLTITCPKHGPFQQIAKEHYRYGCKRCAVESRGKSRRMTTEQFIEKARAVHGDVYSYHLTEYGSDNKTPVEITCPEHGSFFQKPNGHLSGEGCPRCGRAKARDQVSDTRSDFIRKAVDVHGGKYSYEKVKYVNSAVKVTITCPEHGDFRQPPGAHLSGVGCRKCFNDSMRGPGMTTEQFIEKARAVHGEKYQYTCAAYTGAYNDVTVNCPEHGDFSIKAVYHTQGQGCPHCAIHGFNKEKPGTVYLLVSDDRTMMKIGLSNAADRRLRELRTRTPFGFHVATTREFSDGHEAVACESHLHSLYENAGLKDFDGATEWFNLDFNAYSELNDYESD